MPAKSGTSHAFAAFVSMILGSVLSSYIKIHAEPIADFTTWVGGLIVNRANLPLPEEMSGMVVIVVVLSFLWGVAYHVARHGNE